MHEESNCSLPPTAAVMPAVSSSNDDFACDVGMEAYHLAQLDQQLCRDVASNVLWTSNPRADHSCSGQFSRPAPSSVGRSFQSRGFVKRNRPGYFVDRQDGTRAAAAKNNEYIGRRPKVMNGPQRGNSASAHNNDDTGKTYKSSVTICNNFVIFVTYFICYVIIIVVSVIFNIIINIIITTIFMIIFFDLGFKNSRNTKIAEITIDPVDPWENCRAGELR